MLITQFLLTILSASMVGMLFSSTTNKSNKFLLIGINVASIILNGSFVVVGLLK
jgi:hypothetical protein